MLFAAAIMGCFGSAALAHAEAMPADCSAGEIADQPLMLRQPGEVDQPMLAARIVGGGTITVSSEDGEEEETYQILRLELTDRTPSGVFDTVSEISASLLVEPGQSLANRTFRKFPVPEDASEFDGQEKLGDELVFQGWSVKIPVSDGEYGDYAVNVNHVFYDASVRLEFGPQDGDRLPGKIHLCVPGGQESPFDRPPNTQVEITGSFTATVE